jgi:hypothetical protein
MLAIFTSDLYKYLALAVLLLVILFGYWKGRNAVAASGRSLAWTRVPLIAWVIVSVGPSIFAIMIYLGYKLGLMQPGPGGYQFSILVQAMPLDFAVINWGFVALFLVCRLWPNFRGAKAAMWFSIVAMLVPNILVFALAPEMISGAKDAGQGIGVIEAMLILPIVAMILPGPISGIFDTGFGIGPVISTLMAPMPFLGVIGWLIGWAASRVRPKAPMTRT